MTPYGLSLLAVMATGFLPWSYLFEGLGKLRQGPTLPLCIAALTVALATYLYADMLVRFAPEGRGWPMLTFLTASIHVCAIALGGLLWTILGPGLARRFLNTPLALLLAALALALLALVLSLTFTPEAT